MAKSTRTSSKAPATSYKNMTADEILDNYNPKFRACRLAHNPRALYRVVSRDEENRPIVRERTELCRRCGRTRSFLIDRRGYRVSSNDSTWYPPGYLTPKSGLLKRDFAAMEYLDDFEKALLEGRVKDDAENVTRLHSA